MSTMPPDGAADPEGIVRLPAAMSLAGANPLASKASADEAKTHAVSHKHAPCILQSHSEPIPADAGQTHAASGTADVGAEASCEAPS